MFEDLKDKVVIVTGSSNGVGEAIAKLFASYGSKVVVASRNEPNVYRVAELCKLDSPFKYEALPVVCDISKEDDVKRLVNSTIGKFGKCDVLVNNAASFKDMSILDERILDVYDESSNVNVRGLIHICHEILPYLIKTKGTIVNISVFPVPTFVCTLPTKIAVDTLTQVVAKEFASHGVRVNSVGPGAIKTPSYDRGIEEHGAEMHDWLVEKSALKRIGKPEDIANTVLFLSSDAAGFMTGAKIIVDGGFTLS